MTSSDNITLHGALVAIQKSFSRLSEMSSDVSKPERAKALIIGNVNFNLEFQADIDEAESVIINKGGAVSMSYSGTIATDIRLEPEEGEEQTHE